MRHQDGGTERYGGSRVSRNEHIEIASEVCAPVYYIEVAHAPSVVTVIVECCSAGPCLFLCTMFGGGGLSVRRACGAVG